MQGYSLAAPNHQVQGSMQQPLKAHSHQQCVHPSFERWPWRVIPRLQLSRAIQCKTVCSHIRCSHTTTIMICIHVISTDGRGWSTEIIQLYQAIQCRAACSHIRCSHTTTTMLCIHVIFTDGRGWSTEFIQLYQTLQCRAACSHLMLTHSSNNNNMRTCHLDRWPWMVYRVDPAVPDASVQGSMQPLNAHT